MGPVNFNLYKMGRYYNKNIYDSIIELKTREVEALRKEIENLRTQLSKKEAMKAQAQELIDSGNSREKAEGFGMMRVIEAVDKLIEVETAKGTNDTTIVDFIYELIINNR